ncbi:MAG: hypothetical protein K9K39_03260 [Desulfohalobiaceae bacterium]|nr:hypothetical protein [Desulfohalobiaceae bacterium]
MSCSTCRSTSFVTFKHQALCGNCKKELHPGEAVDMNLVCINCGNEPYSRCYTQPGKQEVLISGLCELCFDEITSEPEEEGALEEPEIELPF